MNSLLFPRIHYEFIFGFANPLWIHFLLREYSMNSFSVACIHYPSREYIMNSQSISQFTIDRVSFSRIHYEITLNSLSIPLIHYYSLTKIWWNFNWAEFLWINANFSFEVSSYFGQSVKYFLITFFLNWVFKLLKFTIWPRMSIWKSFLSLFIQKPFHKVNHRVVGTFLLKAFEMFFLR